MKTRIIVVERERVIERPVYRELPKKPDSEFTGFDAVILLGGLTVPVGVIMAYIGYDNGKPGLGGWGILIGLIGFGSAILSVMIRDISKET